MSTLRNHTAIAPDLPEGGGKPSYHDLLYSTDQFHEIAANSKTEWIIDKLLPRGGMNMISGQSFAGKTVWLLWMLGKILSAKPVFQYSTTPGEVVYINGDLNPTHRLARYLDAGLDRKTDQFHYVKSNPSTLTADYLDNLVHAVWDQRGECPVLVVMDTLRPLLFMDAAKGDDLDAVAMTKLLKPFRDLTTRYGGMLTLMLGYHNNRGQDTYYGSGAFLNLLDSIWNYSRHPDNNIATMTVQTREGREELKLAYRDGQFTRKVNDPVIVADMIVGAAEGADISQRGMEKALNGTATREPIRAAYGKLVEVGVLVAGKKKQTHTLAPDWATKYAQVKASAGA